MKAGLIGVVLASLTGSVLGNLLLVAGLSFFVGGVKFKRQKFNVFDARHNSGLLMFAIIVAFVIPEVFSMEMNEGRTMSLSIGISVILILLYLFALFFKLVTHRGVYQSENSEGAHGHDEEPEWSKGKALLILAASTVAVAYVSERLVHTFEEVGEAFGWSELFIGVIIVAIVGNAAEHASAVIIAGVFVARRKGRAIGYHPADVGQDPLHQQLARFHWAKYRLGEARHLFRCSS